MTAATQKPTLGRNLTITLYGGHVLTVTYGLLLKSGVAIEPNDVHHAMLRAAQAASTDIRALAEYGLEAKP